MKDEIIELIQKTIYAEPGTITQTSRIDDIAKDSMDIVELIAVLSEKYRIAIDPVKLKNIKTVGDICNFVIKNQDTQKADSSLERF